MNAYRDFLVRHAPVVASIESLLDSVTYILPGRFEHAEIVAEGLHSLISLLAVYHDSVLGKRFGAKSPSQFNRFTRKLMGVSPLARLAAYFSALCEFTQVFAEMVAKDYVGEQVRWSVIAKVEALKLVCRIILFHASKRRMLLGSHIPERDYDMASIQAQRLETATSHTEAEEKNVRIGQHSGKQIPSLNLFREGKEGASGVSLSEVDVLNLINSKGESASDVLLPMDLVGPLEGVDAVAEWMHILRPVIYLIALQRCGTKSWNPWLLSLALEVTSLGIHANSSRKHKFLERDEMQRRAWLLAYYLLRDPVYSLFVKERLNKFCDAMAKRPIISLASNLLADYIPLWENYYFLVNP